MDTTTTTEAVTPDAYYDKSNRHHLLKWFNTLMKTNFTDVVQTNSGACHCQLMDWLFPGSIDVSSVKFQANGEEDYKHNFTMLQEAFRSRSVTKDVPVEELVKGDFKTNLHFLKWFKAFFTENLKNQEYDVVAARNGQDINPTGFMRPPKAPKAQIRKRDTDTEEDESNYRLKKVQKIPYDPSWKEECYWAEPSPKGAHNTYCTVCKCHLSTAHKGLHDVRRHEESNKHRMRSQRGKPGAPRPAREPGAPRPAREAEVPLPCSEAAIQFILKHCYSGSEVSEQASRHYPRYMLGLHYPKDIMVACRRTPYSLYVYGGVTLGAAYGVSVVLVGYFDAKASRYSVRLLDAIRDVAGETAPAVAEVIKRFDLQPANLIAVYSEGSTPAASEQMCSALRELNPQSVALAGLYNLVEPACRAAVKQLTISGVQVEELMADIYAHYSSASTKDDNLKALFTSSGDDVQSPPDPSNTSCLDPSNTSCLNLCRMVTKLVGMWNELETYFGSYADDDKAKAICSRLQDHKLRETLNFLDYAMEPLHAFHKRLQPQDGNPKADLACILEEAGRMLHTYARRLLQPEAVSRYLEWSDAQILRDKASQLTGPRHVTSVYEALACIVSESLPLSFAALKSMAQLLNPYRMLDVSGEAVRELGTRLGLCKTPGEACALSIEFLEFHNLKRIEIQRDKSALHMSLEQRWANVLKDTESTSVLRKLLLGLMSLPCPPLEATSLFGQAVQNGDALLYSGRPETESEVGTTTGGEESDSTSGSSVVIVTSPQRTKKHQNNSDGNCLNGSTKPCEIRLTKIKSPNGSDNDTSGKDEGPTRGGFGWETSLRQKPPARTVFQAGKGTWDRPVDPEQENGKKEEPVKDTSVKSTTKGRPRRQSRYQDGHGFQAAELVWGKLKLKKGWAWWPGMITPWPRATPPPGFRRVEWFGDGLYSEMHIYAILPLADFNKCFSKTDFEDVPLYKDAIYQILELAAQRSSKLFSEAEHNKDKELQCMVAWATGGFLPGGPAAFTPAAVSTGGTDAPKILPDDSDSDFQPVPLKRKYNVVKDNVKTKNRSSISFSREGMMEHVVKNRKKLEDFCLSCGSPEIEVYHPLFEGNICLKCKENFIETLYRYDEDGYQSYCTVCCSGKEVILCGIASCCRCFCKDCLDILVAPETFDKLKDIDPWSCFMCDPTQCGGGGHLKRRDDWSTKVQQFFTNNSAFAFEPHRVYPSIPAQQRRPLKVLSLFDGIATGYLTLKQLGFKIERYIASEICEDSIAVGMVKHNGEIEHVNDVRTITRKHLAEWGPFDLLIGGSPCNDLSMVNPLRKGLFEGTGRLFFEFYRILTMLRPKDNDDRPFFWLFENVVFMAANDKSDICRFLECNPTFIDAVKVSPAHRARYFWGNLPGMNRPLATSLDDKVNLQDCLEIGRVAKFDKVRTITTKSNSIRQGKMGLPVTMNNKEDYLWCTEMEQIFGFPKHYTDVNNMGKNQRQKVLGRSWSVPVIRHLFAPLKDYFECTSVN